MSDPPNQPESGDPEILPKGTILRPSAERMPFGSGGALLPEGPTLPKDYIFASDIVGFPWTRKRGQEWTDTVFRAEIFSYISSFFSSHSWAAKWEVEERTSPPTLGRKYVRPVLVVTVYDNAGAGYEVAQEFAVADQTGAKLAEKLSQITAALEALHP